MLMLQCERSGVYKPPKKKMKLNLKGLGSRKCDYPFRMCGYFKKKTNDLLLAMLDGVHNHELEPKFGGHLLARTLKEEEKKRFIDMTKSLALPRNILTDLKEKNKESLKNIKQVYNARFTCRKSIRGDKMEMQYFIAKMEEHKYVYFTRINYEIFTLEDIFFAHPKFTNMLNIFPTVLVNRFHFSR
ncbi:hypothetical protein MTR_0156s0040 [Medicago truncatula]|uniref:Uncharacterized protein n=1 Tax=Medicago truncatula TaxID=3880 RepID=A0A072THU8_MEDTR|nr:hypothetical protein MTR_0156s0040 [Medicago truncatula]